MLGFVSEWGGNGVIPHYNTYVKWHITTVLWETVHKGSGCVIGFVREWVGGSVREWVVSGRVSERVSEWTSEWVKGVELFHITVHTCEMPYHYRFKRICPNRQPFSARVCERVTEWVVSELVSEWRGNGSYSTLQYIHLKCHITTVLRETAHKGSGCVIGFVREWVEGSVREWVSERVRSEWVSKWRGVELFHITLHTCEMPYHYSFKRNCP